MRVRVTRGAREDAHHILQASLDRWGADGRARYAALLRGAIAELATPKTHPLVRARGDLGPGVKSFHVRHARVGHSVKTPVHVIYFRIRVDVVEIIAILHDRMEPRRWIAPAGAASPRGRGRRRR